MHQITKSPIIIVVASLMLILGTTPSWGAGPPNNDVSDVTGNTAGGTGALFNNAGGNNTAFGFGALQLNTTSSNNTATGSGALGRNTTGQANTAFGSAALQQNTTGYLNTASGTGALQLNTTGYWNTAQGFDALQINTTGYNNTASGVYALYLNKTGSGNTASGVNALQHNTTGYWNTAQGVNALQLNTSGYHNTATGIYALYSNKTGANNTAVGYQALLAATGTGNTAIGWGAGAALTSGSQNIYVGHPGVTSESNTLRLGGSLQTSAYIAGVAGTAVVGNTVLIDSSGKLGTLVSSARYKQDVQPLEAQSEKLQQLRAVTFHYKQAPQGPLQYGLIAEEVAQIYPELVTRNAKGEIEGVRYEELTPLLLNEVQRQQQAIATQQARSARQEQKIETLEAANQHLRAALVQQHAALAARVAQLERAAQRATVASR